MFHGASKGASQKGIFKVLSDKVKWMISKRPQRNQDVSTLNELKKQE